MTGKHAAAISATDQALRDDGEGAATRPRKSMPRAQGPRNDGDFVAVKVLMPRAAMGAPADTISQKTSLTVVGIPPSQFLALLRRQDFDVGVTEVGKLRVVDRVEFLDWLRRHAVVRTMPDVAPVSMDADELDEVERALVQAGARIHRKTGT